MMAKKAKRPAAADPGPPTPSELRKTLGGSHAAYRLLLSMYKGSTREWKRYGRTAPWTLKVSRGDRTLFYVKPAARSFEAIVLLGARATEAALAGRVSKSGHAAIRAARAYAEGRPVRQIVTREADLEIVQQLVAVKLAPEAKP